MHQFVAHLLGFRAAGALVVAVSLATLTPVTARAQIFGRRGVAAALPASDAVALGGLPRSVGVHVNTGGPYLHVAVPAGRGSVRAVAGLRESSAEVGYAAPLAARRVAGAATVLGAEAQAVARFGGVPRAPALRLRVGVPVGMRWGAVAGDAVTPYLVPYLALGRESSPQKSEVLAAAGLGAGLRVGLGRLGLEAAVGDVVSDRDVSLMLGATWRFGR